MVSSLGVIVVASTISSNPREFTKRLSRAWRERESKAALFDKVPSLDRLFRTITQKHLTVVQKRLLLSYSASAAERYQELLKRSSGIEQLVPQHQIASYLGILPESLSRLKKQLR
jgi:CRP-like cAMP-binding protein